MRKILNWEKFENKPFRILENENIQKNDYFLYNDRIYQCKTINGFWINSKFIDTHCSKIVFDNTVIMDINEDKGKPEIVTTPPKDLKIGDKIYYLSEYDFMNGIVLSIGKKNVKIKGNNFSGNTYEIVRPFDKVALPDEIICVVWERWKGVNGRGGYRIERKLYPQYRKPAKNWGYQKWVVEDEYTILSLNQYI